MMKDPEIIDQSIKLLALKIPNLSEPDLTDLREMLPEADKKLFLAFRDRKITLD